MQEVGELAVLSDRGLPFVAVTVNGHEVAFAVDTGSAVSTIDPATVGSLGLASTGSRSFPIMGVDGFVRAPVVPVDDLAVGSLHAHDVILAETGHLGATIKGLKVIGLFGADFLSNYDVELDLPNRRIGLYVEAGRCGSDFDPWDAPAATVRFRLDGTGHVMVPIRLDGASIDAYLDTGAQISVVDPVDARAADVSDAALAADRSGRMTGVASQSVAVKLHRFSSVEVGGIRSGSVLFAVGDTFGALLGENWLRHQTVWISYPHDLLLLQTPTRPAPPP